MLNLFKSARGKTLCVRVKSRLGSRNAVGIRQKFKERRVRKAMIPSHKEAKAE